MANRTFYPSQNYGSGRVYCEFNFLSNNTSSPVLTSVDGADVVASLSRSGAGVIVVTLKDAFNKVITASADLDDTANDGSYATIGGITNEGTATPLSFTVRTRVAAGTLTDFTARKVYVVLSLRNGNWGVK